MEVLQLDVSGRPQAWISAQEAATLYASDTVAWTLGDALRVLRGGIQRATGLPSRIEVHPILAVKGAVPSRAWRVDPALSNPKLFARDRHLCAYCGRHFRFDELTREHIVPVSRGGRDTWMNCITACRLSRSKPLPVHDVSEWTPRKRTSTPHFRIRSGYEFGLRVRRRVR